VRIATKFGFAIDAQGRQAGLDSRPEHIRQVADASLRRLGVEVIGSTPRSGGARCCSGRVGR
jgi:aryl-alcohol dehydrogenase-like predicted oxidoreductase